MRPSIQNCSLAIVGEGADLEVLDDAAVTPFLEGLDREDRRGRPVATVPEPSEPSAPEVGGLHVLRFKVSELI